MPPLSKLLFGDFTVLENISTSFHLHPRSSLLEIYFSTATHRRNEAYILEQSLKILRLVGLDKVKDELARNLPHGYQKMLGMARAIGETMVVLVLAGGNSSIPFLPTESMRPMTATVAAGFGNATDQSLIRPALYMTGAILFVLTFVTTWIADAILEGQRKKFTR